MADTISEERAIKYKSVRTDMPEIALCNWAWYAQALLHMSWAESKSRTVMFLDKCFCVAIDFVSHSAVWCWHACSCLRWGFPESLRSSVENADRRNECVLHSALLLWQTWLSHTFCECPSLGEDKLHSKKSPLLVCIGPSPPWMMQK